MSVHELSRKECVELLQRNHLGHLACSSDDQPYIVPMYFACDDALYGVSTIGRKIDWLRQNPRVCVEVDDVGGPERWASVVVIGRFEELSDADGRASRSHAYDLLKRQVAWWVPAFSRTEPNHETRPLEPIYFRISLDSISGRSATREGGT